jgi:hypothetical protein
MTIKLRDYDADKDKAAVLRIWREVGWLHEDDEKKEEAIARFISCGRAQIA